MLQGRGSSVSRSTLPCLGAAMMALMMALMLALASGPALAQTYGSLQNGSFESGTGSAIPNWTFLAPSGAGSVVLVQKTSKNPQLADTGTQAAQVTVTQTGSVGLAASRVTVSPGVRYRFTARLRTGLDQQGALHAVEWNAAGQQLADTVVATSSGRDLNWETLRGYLVTQAQTQSVEVRLLSLLPAGAPAVLLWDSVDLTRGDATAWEPWESVITSTADFSPPAANPYRDLLLTATFYKTTTTSCPTPPASCSGAGCFQGYGFWDGVPGTSGRTYRVRTLFPAGSWCWAVSCTGLPGCSTDAGLNSRSAQPVTVLPNVTPGNKLYGLGLPQTSASSRFLVYGDKTTTLPWIADTAWSAPVKYTPPATDPLPSHDIWRSYVWDRASQKGFTALLIALAPDYVAQLPPSGTVPGFVQVSGCQPSNNTVEPNDCTYWDTVYWQKFDQMVKTANDAGLIAVVAGLIDPMDRSGSNTTGISVSFPAVNAATVFARNLASRLANRYVIFSPGFDDFQSDPTIDGKTARDSMNAVGTALKLGGLTLSPIAAVPRHMVVEHLAGGSPFSDYDLFQGQSWLSFQLFQSGHGANSSGATPQCPATSDATAYSICRARELALHFRCMGDPSIPSPPCPSPRPAGTVKPAANAEAAYEKFSVTRTTVDNPNGVRNTAYATGLSGSIGFTLGIEGIYDWSNPAIYSNSYSGNLSRSDDDLGRLASLFRGAPWTDLTPRHNLILNNSTVEEQRMVLAGSSTYALLYAPNLPQTASVTLSTTASNALPGLTCKASWSMLWVSPMSDSSVSKQASCSVGTGQITFSGQPPCSAGGCDWVLELTKTIKASDSSAGIASLATTDFITWADSSPDGSTSAIMGQLLDLDGNPIGDPITVNSDGETFDKLPTAAVNLDGNFLVAWQTELPDGTLDTISARWLDANGNAIGDTFQTATGSDGQQAEPALSGDASGNVLVTWTAYAADGSTSEIYLQIVSDGDPSDNDTLQPVNDPSQLDVSSSQVQASAQGSAVVAWNATDSATGVPGVYFQRFNPHGKPVGPQRRVGHQTSGRRRLIKLATESPGNFRIRWEGFDPAGNSLGLFEQRYDSGGNEDGGETPVTFNP
jgi:hypothetical protein